MKYDLPEAKEKQAIWRMYVEQYGLDVQQAKPAHDLWTGAEIKSCCRLAALLDLPLVEAATNVVPVAKTASEAVEKLRAWASGRCLSADRPGIYTSPSCSTIRPGRKVSRDPSQN
jgi:hypothetical protein